MHLAVEPILGHCELSKDEQKAADMAGMGVSGNDQVKTVGSLTVQTGPGMLASAAHTARREKCANMARAELVATVRYRLHTSRPAYTVGKLPQAEKYAP